MSKYNGVTAKKKEERESKKKDGLQAFLAQIQSVQQKFINEWAQKHNQLGTLVDSVFKIATTEVGKLWGNQQAVFNSVDHIDINVLALSELNKALIKRLAEYDAKFKKLEELAGEPLVLETDAAAIEAAGKELYATEMKKAFETVLERRKKEDEERKAAAEKAAADAKAADEAKSEAERAEVALREAETPQSLTDLTEGGKGSEIPDGAQVFGGA
jgi:hypothetical protein